MNITDADILNAAANHEEPRGLWHPKITFRRHALLNFARELIAMAAPVVKDKLTIDDHKAAAAVRTLEMLGYTHQGGVMWKPPIGRTYAHIKDDSKFIDEIRSMLIKCDCSECSLRNKPILEVLKIVEAKQ